MDLILFISRYLLRWSCLIVTGSWIAVFRHQRDVNSGSMQDQWSNWAAHIKTYSAVNHHSTWDEHIVWLGAFVMCSLVISHVLNTNSSDNWGWGQRSKSLPVMWFCILEQQRRCTWHMHNWCLLVSWLMIFSRIARGLLKMSYSQFFKCLPLSICTVMLLCYQELLLLAQFQEVSLNKELLCFVFHVSWCNQTLSSPDMLALAVWYRL